MIRHCVFLRFRSDLLQAEKDGIWADLAALKALIPGFEALHIGANVSPEGLGKGFASISTDHQHVKRILSLRTTSNSVAASSPRW